MSEKTKNVENQNPEVPAKVEENKVTFKQKLANAKLEKQKDKLRKEEIKLELLSNPQNADALKKEKKEISKRQLKRAAIPAAVVATAVVGTVVVIAKRGGGDDEDDAIDVSSEEISE